MLMPQSFRLPGLPAPRPRRRQRGASIAMLLVSAALVGCTHDVATFSHDYQSSGPAVVWEAEAEVVRVIDGDTIAVAPIPGTLAPTNDAGDEHHVRLLGIDTPEMNYRADDGPECGAQEATDHLEEILPQGQTVLLKWDAYADHADQYGRSLAYVRTDDTATGDVGGALIAGGYAVPYVPRGEPRPEMSDLYEAIAAAAATAGPLSECAAT